MQLGMVWMLGVLAVTLPVLGNTPFAAEPVTLKLYNWKYYASERLFNRFTEQSGVAIQEVYFDSDETRDRILFRGRFKEFDLTVIDDQTIDNYIDGALLQPLSATLLQRTELVAPEFSDACQQHGVPYLWGSVGIAYRQSKVTKPLTRWEDLMRPQESIKGGIIMLQDASELLIPPLKMAGFSVNSNDRGELKQAYQLLQAQKPAVLAYANPLEFVTSDPRRDKLVATMLYNGDLDTLVELSGADDWQFVVPEEGSAIWVDCLVALVGTEHRAGIEQLLQMLLEPEYAAWLSEDTEYASPVQGVERWLPKAISDDPRIYVPSELRGKIERYGDVSASEDLRTRILLSTIR